MAGIDDASRPGQPPQELLIEVSPLGERSVTRAVERTPGERGAHRKHPAASSP